MYLAENRSSKRLPIERRHAETETNRGCRGLGMTAIPINTPFSAAMGSAFHPGLSNLLILG